MSNSPDDPYELNYLKTMNKEFYARLLAETLKCLYYNKMHGLAEKVQGVNDMEALGLTKQVVGDLDNLKWPYMQIHRYK